MSTVQQKPINMKELLKIAEDNKQFAKKLKNKQLLIDGYTRSINESFIIPIALKELCLLYMVTYRFFDVYPSGYSRFVLNNGMIFHKSRHQRDVQYGCSNGYNKHGIHKYSIQSMQCSEGDGIGITSNLNECKNEGVWIHSSKYYAYFIWGGGGIFASKRKNPKHSQWNLQKWDKNDIITVITDCDNWTIKFEINGKDVGKTMSIAKNHTYFPVICLQKSNVEYRVLQSDCIILD